MATFRTLSAALLLVIAGLVVGTGGGCSASPEAAVPPTYPSATALPAQPPPSTLEGALAELDAKEAQVTAILGGSLKASPAVGVPDEAAQGLAGGVPAARNADPCFIACSALGSMQRSAERVCSLAGEDDTRCVGARDRVASATARVSAACPACPAQPAPTP